MDADEVEDVHRHTAINGLTVLVDLSELLCSGLRIALSAGRKQRATKYTLAQH